MTVAAEQLKTILRDLPQGDRAELAHFLLRSLDSNEGRPGVGADESLDSLLHRRRHESQSGLPVNEPIESALAELRELLP